MLRNATKHGLRAALSLTAVAGLLAVGAPAASAISWTPSTHQMNIQLKGDVTIAKTLTAPPNQRIHCSNFTLRSQTTANSSNQAHMVWLPGFGLPGTINTCVNEGTGASGTFRMEAIGEALYNGSTFSLGWMRLDYLWYYPSMLGPYAQGSGTGGQYAFTTPWTNGSGSTPSTVTFNNTPIGLGMRMTGTLAVTQYPSGGLVTLNP